MPIYIRTFLFLTLFIVAGPVYSQNYEQELQQVVAYMTSGQHKECREACTKLLNNGRDIDALTLLGIEFSLATSDFLLGYSDEGLHYLTLAEGHLSKAINPSTEDYVSWLTALSALYGEVDNKKSQSLLKQAIDICDKNGWTHSEGYVFALIRLCALYNQMDTDVSAAVDKILERLIPLSKEICGNESTAYTLTLLEAIKNAERKGESGKQLEYTKLFVDNPRLYLNNPRIRTQICSYRIHALLQLKQYDSAISEAIPFSKQLKQKCIDDFKGLTSEERLNTIDYIQKWYLNEFTRLLASNPEGSVLSDIYDGLLFAKGLMLSLDMIQDNADESVLLINWRDLQKQLKPDEAAIEFCCYVDDNGILTCQYYKALVIRPGSSMPRLIDIGIWTASKTFHNVQAQCQFFWKHLTKELKGVTHLYFSPYGILHTVPIESFIPQDLRGLRVSRLSSTRQIALRSKRKGTGSALFGGLLFDMNVEDMKAYALKRGAEAMLDYLPGTKKEVEQVGAILQRNNSPFSHIALYTDDAGTEHSFKALSRSGVGLIHLATHGFYYKADEAKGYLNSSDITVGHNKSIEDKPMTRTGLFMGGAGLANTSGMEADDGILTAQEISKMDLKGLNLVVLSACETAEGDINYDGVFGLQRGFKKAGAQSILMSLWKVDDEATCLLMTEFYKNWIGERMTKHDALEAAKQTVRSHKEKGWNDPKYWAAFILLDALD